MKRRHRLILPVALFLAVAGCTLTTRHTIDAHITVDIRHITQQAENVLDFVEGKTDTLPGLENVSPTSSLLDRMSAPFRFTQVAHAAELKETSSPLVAQIATQMRNRFQELQAFKTRQAIGENNRGYVELRPEADALETGERTAAERIVAAENNDRRALYREIARLNRADGITVVKVEEIYYLERLNRARSGEIFQLPAGGAVLDDFRQSATGRRLGEAVRPNAWVAIP